MTTPTPFVADSPQPTARHRGEALGVGLTRALHAALSESRPWSISASLVSSYEKEAVCVLGSKQANTSTNIALLLRSANLVGSTWSDAQITATYVPARINVVVSATVLRFDGTNARALQAIEFRCQHFRWAVRRETLFFLTSPTPLCGKLIDVGTQIDDASTPTDDTVVISN